MTREEAKALIKASLSSDYGLQFQDAVAEDVDIIYANISVYLTIAMNKAESREARVALQGVKDYLEGKDESK